MLDVSSALWALGNFVGSRHRKKKPYSLTLGAGYPHRNNPQTLARMSLCTPSLDCQQVRAEQGSWLSDQGSDWGTVGVRT